MTYSSPLSELPGAVAAPDDHPEAGVPWHWGDPLAEQRTAARGVAVVDRSHRHVITVSGSERLSWLHLVLSQHVSDLPADTGTESLVLDAQGRVDAHMLVAYTGDVVYLDTDPDSRATSAMPGGAKQTLVEYLQNMKFWSDVEVVDATGDYAVLTLVGPDADQALGVLGTDTPLELPAEPYSVVALPEGGLARRMPWPGTRAIDLLVPRADVVNVWKRLTDAGARPAGSWAYDALRVESLAPRVGLDTDERAIPHEVGWIGSAAHVAKGCYRGQETVAKVFNVGRPPRNMVLLHLDGSAEIYPETGDPVTHGERTVGRVGSVAQHHELGPIALALVKRSTPTDAELLAGSGDETAQASIDPDSVPAEGAAPGREAVQRLRG